MFEAFDGDYPENAMHIGNSVNSSSGEYLWKLRNIPRRCFLNQQVISVKKKKYSANVVYE